MNLCYITKKTKPNRQTDYCEDSTKICSKIPSLTVCNVVHSYIRFDFLLYVKNKLIEEPYCMFSVRSALHWLLQISLGMCGWICR